MFRINHRKLAHFWQKYIFTSLFPTKRTTRFKSNRRTIHLFTENQPEIIRAERWSKIHFKMSSQPLLTLISSRRSSSIQREIQAYSSEKPRIKTHRYLSSFLVSSRSLVSIRRCQHLNTPRRFAIRPSRILITPPLGRKRIERNLGLIERRNCIAMPRQCV